MKVRKILLAGITVCTGISLLSSCEEEGLVMNSNDVSYVGFAKDATKDTTKICFELFPFEEGMDVKIARVPLEVSIRGKMQDKDLEFNISIDQERTTLPISQCILPEKCVVKSGQLVDTIYVKFKNSDDLKTAAKIVALKINAEGEVQEGVSINSRAIIQVTDHLVKPDWWEYKDISGTDSSVDWYYLGNYSKDKYRLFLTVLQKNDDVLFDGKDKVKLRKYSLQLKYMVEEINAQRDPNDPLRDEETKELITIPVAG